MTITHHIEVSFEKLRSVVHISDIHIRLFRRHIEYTQAFENLYKDLESRDLRDSVIVLAGDIVHAKTDMSPEMVKVTSEFLTRVSSFAPTILIAGNHDLNLANSHRLDSLTPIVENLNLPHLHYAKYSSIVKVADTDFAVFSIVDDRSTWPSANSCTADNKVALYHGPVHGATTDSNFTITNRHTHVDTFDGFDMVMLGDIHRHQVLQDYNPNENKPIIVYSSSLIQQNHGESIEGHGWCLWDIASRTFEFIPLKNDFGYCTLEIKNGKIDVPKNMPPNARVRLFTGDLDNTKVKKLISTLKKKHSLIELSVNKSRYRRRLNINTNVMGNQDSLDLSNPSTQMIFIEDWLKRNAPNLDPSVISKIQDLNTDLNSNIVHDDQSRNIHWRPISFEFDNMFSYGDGNRIDFSGMEGLYGIFAANASGKSSIMDSLMFCLYDKTPRAFRGHDIMNNRKDTFYCQLKFEINDEIYRITRYGNRKKNGSVKVDVDFCKLDEFGDEISLNGESRRDTNSIIRNYVGTYEDFMMTAMSGQTSNALFIDKSHSERKDLLIQFMGLSVFDTLYAQANEEVKEITGVLKTFNKTDVTDKLTNNKDRIKELHESILELAKSKDNLFNKRQGVSDEYMTLNQKRESVPELDDSLDEMRSELESWIEKRDMYSSRLNNVKKKIGVTKKEILEKKGNIALYDYDDLVESLSKHNDAIKKRGLVLQKLELITSQIKEKTGLKSKLGSYNYNPDCDVCIENNRGIINDINEVSAELSNLSDVLEEKKDRLTVLTDEIKELSPKIEDYNYLTDEQGELGDLERELDVLVTSKRKIKLDIDMCGLKIKTIERNIEIYQKNENAIKQNLEIDQKCAVLEEKINDYDQIMRKMDNDLSDLKIERSVLESKQDDLKQKLLEAEELETTYEAYENYMSAISRNGVPYELITKTIPSIEAEINDILSQIVDFSISLEVDEKYINGKLIYDYDRIWPLENSSGMERFVSSLAIRVALMNVSNLPKPNFLIIDEGFGVLDSEHLHSMQTLFNLLKTHFDFILIVSHLDSARDMVDNLIEIYKEDGFSHVSV